VTPAPSNQRVAQQTGMLMHSIGPTRDRAFARLREDGQFARAVRQ
jgi:hypothetical protein